MEPGSSNQEDVSTGSQSERPLRRVRFRRRPVLVGLALGLVAVAVAVASAGKPGLSHMKSGGISFDYPAQWRVIHGEMGFHYDAVVAVVGTGGWDLPCWTVAPTGEDLGGVQCGSTTWNVLPGTVVVYISAGYGLPRPPELKTIPPEATPIGHGVVATELETVTSSLWGLYMPDGLRVGIEARFAAPGIDVIRAQVRSLVMSIREDSN